MVKKGIISNVQGTYASVFLPDEDNAVTPLLPISKNVTVSVGDRCVVAFFASDVVNLADGVIIAVY